MGIRAFSLVTCMTVRKIIPSILFLATGALFAYVLYQRYQLGLVRFFDMDEFMYPHWAHNILLGQVPYRDFFIFVTPGYLLFLTPLFLFGSGVTPLIIGRVSAFLIFGLTAGAVGLLFYEVRKFWLSAVVTALILAILPLPFDKFLEIRPDTLATLLVVVGMICQIRWFKKGRKAWAFSAGICYSISLLVLQKLLPNIALASLIALWFIVTTYVLPTHNKMFGQRLRSSWQAILPFGAGLAIPWILFFLWAAIFVGSVDQTFYLISKAALEHAEGVRVYNPLPPDFFFRPNPTYYGEWGYSPGLIVNHVLWGSAFILAAIRLITSVIPPISAKKQIDILIAGSFIAQVALFIFYDPLKFTQYLIPAAIFVAWFTGDWVYILWQFFRKSAVGIIEFFILSLAGLFILHGAFASVYAQKINWTNAQDLDNLTKLLSAIPRSEYVLDLEGRTTYYRDPYYVCCLPFGQFGPFLTRPLPSLSQALEKTKTKYIYQANFDRIGALLPEDQIFIRKHYTASGSGELWVSKDW